MKRLPHTFLLPVTFATIFDAPSANHRPRRCIAPLLHLIFATQELDAPWPPAHRPAATECRDPSHVATRRGKGAIEVSQFRETPRLSDKGTYRRLAARKKGQVDRGRQAARIRCCWSTVLSYRLSSRAYAPAPIQDEIGDMRKQYLTTKAPYHLGSCVGVSDARATTTGRLCRVRTGTRSRSHSFGPVLSPAIARLIPQAMRIGKPIHSNGRGEPGPAQAFTPACKDRN